MPNATPEKFTGTPILQVISEYCMQNVNDQRLQELAHEDMPLYARRVWGLFRPSIPLFNTPAEMPIYLLGTKDDPHIQEPKYDTYTVVIPEEQTENYTVSLGESFIGYELFACRIRMVDELGNVYLYPTSLANYDAETGEVTFSASAEQPLEANATFEMDFYTDGHFKYELSPEIMRVLGVCFQYTWQNRFNTDYLSLVPKVDSKSFTEQNRANKERADTERLSEIKRNMAEAMRRYEQIIAQRNTIRPQMGGMF